MYPKITKLSRLSFHPKQIMIYSQQSAHPGQKVCKNSKLPANKPNGWTEI